MTIEMIEQPPQKPGSSILTFMVAELVKLSAAARENSYDTLASNKAQRDAEARNMLLPAGTPQWQREFVDFSKFYRLTLEEACEQVCNEKHAYGMGRFIYLALDGWWNDALAWAEEHAPTPKQEG